MRFSVLFLVVFVGPWINNVNADDGLDIGGIDLAGIDFSGIDFSGIDVPGIDISGLDIGGLLKIGVRFLVLNLKRVIRVTLTDSATLTLPASLKDVSIGSVTLKNASVYGFDTLNLIDVSTNDVKASDSSYTKTNLYLNLEIDHLGISTGYDADIGILDQIPVYGDGELNLAVSKVKLDVSLNLNMQQNFSQIYVDDVSVHIQFHDAPSYITRFWKNDYASDIVTEAINILEELLGMWITYETECAACVISPVVKYVINSILPNGIEDELNIQCTCLQDVLKTLSNVEDIIQKVEDLLKEGFPIDFSKEETFKELKGVLKETVDGVGAVLRREGLSLVNTNLL